MSQQTNAHVMKDCDAERGARAAVEWRAGPGEARAIPGESVAPGISSMSESAWGAKAPAKAETKVLHKRKDGFVWLE